MSRRLITSEAAADFAFAILNYHRMRLPESESFNFMIFVRKGFSNGGSDPFFEFLQQLKSDPVHTRQRFQILICCEIPQVQSGYASGHWSAFDLLQLDDNNVSVVFSDAPGTVGSAICLSLLIQSVFPRARIAALFPQTQINRSDCLFFSISDVMSCFHKTPSEKLHVDLFYHADKQKNLFSFFKAHPDALRCRYYEAMKLTVIPESLSAVLFFSIYFLSDINTIPLFLGALFRHTHSYHLLPLEYRDATSGNASGETNEQRWRRLACLSEKPTLGMFNSSLPNTIEKWFEWEELHVEARPRKIVAVKDMMSATPNEYYQDDITSPSMLS